MYEKVDERTAVTKYGVTPVTTKWIDRDMAFEGEPLQVRSRTTSLEFESGDRPDFHWVCVFPQRPVLVRLLAADQRHNDTLKKSKYCTLDAASAWECHWQKHLEHNNMSC